MLVYRGKLNWFQYAVNEGFTVIFPGPELKIGAPAIAAWQWTVDAHGKTKGDNFQQGVIDSVVILENGERQVYFHQDEYYRFQAILSDDMTAATVTMSNPSGSKSSPTVLDVKYSVPLTAGVTPRYFLGKMNWLSYAKDEMYLVIIPGYSTVGSDIISYWQWTVDSQGKEKANANFQDIIRTAEDSSQGEVVTFGDDATTYYTFTGTISEDGSTFTVNMKNPGGAKGGPFVLALQV